MQIEKTTPLYPIPLLVTLDGVGVTGLTPTIKIREALSGDYYDFSDQTFKASGWVQQTAPMIDVGTGNYQYTLAVASIAAIQPGALLVAEYHFDDGAGLVGDSSDPIEVVRIGADASLSRKVLSNRKKEVAGNPGTLTIYDDDGTTPLLVGDLTDASGGEVTSVAGSPAEFVPQ